MSKHTPGPWTYDGRRNSLVGKYGTRVAFYGDGIAIAISEPTAEERANYRLAVTAPELLEALKAVIAAWSEYDADNSAGVDDIWDEVAIAKLAIAKAEGK